MEFVEKEEILGLDLVKLRLPVAGFDEQLLFPAPKTWVEIFPVLRSRPFGAGAKAITLFSAPAPASFL